VAAYTPLALLSLLSHQNDLSPSWKHRARLRGRDDRGADQVPRVVEQLVGRDLLAPWCAHLLWLLLTASISHEPRRLYAGVHHRARRGCAPRAGL
jgi:hypothetical protein